MASEIDRLNAERDYIEGRGSYSELACRYGVAKRTVERWGAAGRWEDRRQAFVGGVSAAVGSAVGAVLVDEATRRTREHLADWESARQVLRVVLASVVTPLDLKNWTAACRTLQQGEREALGLAPPKLEQQESGDDGISINGAPGG